MLEHKEEKIFHCEPAVWKASVALESIHVDFLGDGFIDENPFGMIHIVHAIGVLGDGHQSHQFLIVAVVTNDGAYVLLVPVTFQLHQAHGHIALLHQSLEKAHLVKPARQASRHGNIFRRHVQALGDPTHHISNFFLVFVLCFFGIQELLLQEVIDGSVHQTLVVVPTAFDALRLHIRLLYEIFLQLSGENSLVLAPKGAKLLVIHIGNTMDGFFQIGFDACIDRNFLRDEGKLSDATIPGLQSLSQFFLGQHFRLCRTDFAFVYREDDHFHVAAVQCKSRLIRG